MNKKKFTKLLALYLPYLVIGLAATNLGEAWRLAEGKELGDKIVSLMGTLPAAFANPLPSLHTGYSGGHLLRCWTEAGRLSEKQKRQKVPARHGVWLRPMGHTGGYCTIYSSEI